MANFAIVNTTGVGAGSAQSNMTTTYKTLVLVGNSTGTTSVVGGGALRRGKIYDILVGTNGTPADNYMEWDVTKVTMGASSVLAGGISSVSSALSLDPADNNGFVAMAGINSSIETAFTALQQLWYVGVNQRASYRWVAAPGSEIVYPAASSATGGNGLGLRARSGAYTGTATGTVLFTEQ